MEPYVSMQDQMEEEYDVSNQRQILESVSTIKNELNFSFQKDLKDEQDAYKWFIF